MLQKQGAHFEISERKLFLRIVDVLIIWAGVYALNYFTDFYYISLNENFIPYLGLLSFYYLLFATIFEMYHLQKAESRFIIVKNLLLTSTLTIFVFLFTPILSPQLPSNRIEVLFLFSVIFVPIAIWRFLYIGLISAPRFTKKVVLVGENFNPQQIKNELENADSNIHVIGFLDGKNEQKNCDKCTQFNETNFLEGIKEHRITEVLVTNSYEGVNQNLQSLLYPLLEKGLTIKPYSHVYENLTDKVLVENIENDFYCYFPFNKNNSNQFYLTINRLVNIFVSSLGLLLSLPLLPFVFIGNMMGNRGPLLYTQKRVGKYGQVFKIYKLRSMVTNAEKSGAQWAEKNDNRVTAFGKFLRKTRLDEIPQFINILNGDMSLIGPRPERPEFVEELAKTIPFYKIRNVIKPGLTGWAQVHARYAATDRDSLEKLQYDLYYIKNRGLFIDFRITIKTLSTVIFFRGQ
ncbi:MAG: exopolysaccharide biosynthesis polyprenyl glycosylphosphotransferase [Psychroflexus halocasei]